MEIRCKVMRVYRFLCKPALQQSDEKTVCVCKSIPSRLCGQPAARWPSRGNGFTQKNGHLLTKRQRSIGTVHKELELLRRMFNVAVSNGWLMKNPFEMGDSLINPSDEKQRERILTKEEEEKLLAACFGPRAHLRSIIVCALDTGMRRGEIFKLKWSDIDFENGIINIKAFNTKTLRERQVAMTSRLSQELYTLWENSKYIGN